MHRIVRLPCAFLIALLAFNVAAMDIQEAKSAGFVGERLDGYLGLVATSAPSEAKNLVKKINAARRQKYQGIASKNKLSVKQVETLAAEKAINKTRRGHYIQNRDGKWVKK